MADVSVYKINRGGSDSLGESAAAAPSQTVPPSGKDSRLALRVANENATAVRVTVLSGGGPRAALGDMNIDVGAGNTEYIALFDTARFKDITTGKITIFITDTNGGALTTELASVRIEAVQM